MPKEELIRICDDADMVIIYITHHSVRLKQCTFMPAIEALANQGRQNFLFWKMVIPQ